MEAAGEGATMEDYVCRYAGDKLPVAKTDKIGHGKDSKAIQIGSFLRLEAEKGK